jgi:hypothetical protein
MKTLVLVIGLLSVGLSAGGWCRHAAGQSGSESPPMLKPVEYLADVRPVVAGGNLESLGYDTLVVSTLELMPTLQRWVAYRTGQGHRILVVPSKRFAAQNRDFVHRIAASHRGIKNLVLVGDGADWTKPPTSLVPVDHVMAKVNLLFGSEYEIATDNTYADLDGDDVPELTVGRIVATDSRQLDRYIDRVIQYESSSEDPLWRRRVNLVAGVGGFGSVTDGLIETTAKQIITDKIPACYQTSVTYASWQSPFCPDPRRFSQTAIERFNQGCLFWIYVGHGDRRRLDQVRVPEQRFDILDAHSATAMACRSGSPIAIFLACYTGAIDSSRDCLAEQIIKQPGGPVAVICGSRVTMPYAMGLLSIEMANEFFDGQCRSLGQLMRRSKLGMVADVPLGAGDKYRRMIESMGRSLSPLPKALEAEKREHLHLVNLLGDPLLRLKRPGKIDLQCDAVATAGQTLIVSGNTAVGGQLTVELVYRRDRFRFRPKRRRNYEADEVKLADYQKTYRQAHDQVCVSKRLRINNGPFTTSIQIPADVRGQCEVRAMIVAGERRARGAKSEVATGADFALGSRSVKVAKKTDR